MWLVLSIKLWHWPAKSCDHREGSGKFIKGENQECSRTLNCPCPTWTKPNLHGRQLWSIHETFYNLCLPDLPPSPYGFTFPSWLGTIALQRWCFLWGCLPETGNVMVPAQPFIPPGHKLVCQVAPMYSCVHLYTHCTVCIAQLGQSWIEQYW